MAQVRELMGDAPVYISFDIDVIDPGYAPGTGQYFELKEGNGQEGRCKSKKQGNRLRFMLEGP